MIIEVKQWPESQEVMENSDWFFLMAPRTDSESNPIGDSAYGRVLEDKTHTAGDIVYDNPMYDGEPTTADEYNNESRWHPKWLLNGNCMAIHEDKYDEIKELITDLAWEMEKMSSSGRETLDALWKIFKIDNKNV
tara:strand:+ start:810 stop:1214 length:405 start_codon:yes stop_codon:yes gene_type:complete